MYWKAALLCLTFAISTKATQAADKKNEPFQALKAFSCASYAKTEQRRKTLATRLEDHELQTDQLALRIDRLQRDWLTHAVALQNATTSTRANYQKRLKRQAIHNRLTHLRQLMQHYERRLALMEGCGYRLTLRKLQRSRGYDRQERKAIQQLLKLEKQFASNADFRKLKHQYLPLFRALYKRYWKRSKLSANACQLLGQTYRAWASFYESDNRSHRSMPNNGSIPIYNSNGHNDSYRVWAWEAQKGRIPPHGLTLLHLDTHPDMGGYRDRSPGHWSDRALTLGQINKLLAHKQTQHMRRDLLHLIRTSTRIDKAHKQIAQRQIQQKSDETLRKELETHIYQRVHDIAHPVTAAAYAGITKKLLLCMPPWSHRFEMSRINPKTKRSKGITLRLVKERSTQLTYFGVPKSMAKHPFVDGAELPSFHLFNPTKKKYQSLPHRIAFHVTSCTREDPLSSDPSIIPKLPDLSSYFTPGREGRDGFILGFDLDVFSTNGSEFDNHVIPRSYARTHSLKLQHHKHTKKQAKQPKHQRTHIGQKEFTRVKARVASVFSRLRKAKQKGYIPKLITIADSTNASRAYRDGLHRKALSGGDYVPECLVFLLNYHVKAELLRLYKGKLTYKLGLRQQTNTQRVAQRPQTFASTPG